MEAIGHVIIARTSTAAIRKPVKSVACLAKRESEVLGDEEANDASRFI